MTDVTPPPPKKILNKKNLIYSLLIFFCEFLIHEWDVNVFELFHEDSIIACRKKSSKDPVSILFVNINVRIQEIGQGFKSLIFSPIFL